MSHPNGLSGKVARTPKVWGGRSAFHRFTEPIYSELLDFFCVQKSNEFLSITLQNQHLFQLAREIYIISKRLKILVKLATVKQVTFI